MLEKANGTLDDALILSLADRKKQQAIADEGRIARAASLVIQGKVQLFERYAIVQSGRKGELPYKVAATCPCDDALGLYPSSTTDGMCKHRIAVELAREAQALEQQGYCPTCLGPVESQSFYIGGRGYQAYTFCYTRQNDHYSVEVF